MFEYLLYILHNNIIYINYKDDIIYNGIKTNRVLEEENDFRKII